VSHRDSAAGLTSIAEAVRRPDDLDVATPSSPAAGVHPIGQLDDGTPFFAPLGELQVVDDGDRVICHLCGRAMQLLSAEHLRRHGWTPQLYRSTFGLNRSTALCSRTLAERRRLIGLDRYQRNKKVRNGLARGQELARSGVLLEMSHQVQRPGTAALERRRKSGEVTKASRAERRTMSVRRRLNLVTELGFTSERDYLLDRYLVREWPVARIKAELGVGSSVLAEILDAADITRRRPGGARPAVLRWSRRRAAQQSTSGP
jgi:hypothetical protein